MNRPRRPRKITKKPNTTKYRVRTLLIDGEVLLKRSFAVVKDVVTDDGRTKTVYVFLDSLRRLIMDHGVTKVVVCWEGENSRVVRQDYYQYYKQNRGTQYSEEEEYDLGRQRTIIKQCLEELHIRQVSEDYCEGDDVIAYYCLNSPNESKLIYTIDQDLLQLLADDVQVYLPNKKQIIDKALFTHDWGYPSENIPLIKTIVGDNSDNISGIRGIGKVKFFKHYPELKTEVKDINWLLSESERKLNEDPDNRELSDIVNCRTKFGHHGREYNLVVHKIINLHEPLISEHTMSEVDQAINGVLDTQGRAGVTGVRKIALDFNFYRFFSKNDDRDLEFWSPFTMLMTREKMLWKQQIRS